jgi:hypothetical protein
VRGGGVANTRGEEGRISKDYRIGEVRGDGV